MKKILEESFVYIILFILIFSYKLCDYSTNIYLFWKDIIDNCILLVFLLFMLYKSIDWSWFGKRTLYSLILILILNTYGTLFGLDEYFYYKWYKIPLYSMLYVNTIMITSKIIYKLYSLWEEIRYDNLNN